MAALRVDREHVAFAHLIVLAHAEHVVDAPAPARAVPALECRAQRVVAGTRGIDAVRVDIGELRVRPQQLAAGDRR